MYRHIMVPVDLHMETIVEKALTVATDLAKFYKADITLVSMTGSVITDAPHTPASAMAALTDLASSLSESSGMEVKSHNLFSPDVPAEVDSGLKAAIDAVGADLVVVGSHIPRLIDYVFSSHAGRLASHAKVSVFVVR